MFEDGGGGLSFGQGIFWGFSFSAHFWEPHLWEATAFTAEQHLPSYPTTVTMIFLLCSQVQKVSYKVNFSRHFHISHNTPCLPPTPPPPTKKINCITHVYDLSLLMQIWGGGRAGNKLYYGRCANGLLVIDYLHNEWKLLEDFKSYIFNTVSFLSDLNNTTSCSQAKSWAISSSSQKGKHPRISPTIRHSRNLFCFRCTNNCTMSLGVVVKRKQKIYP